MKRRFQTPPDPLSASGREPRPNTPGSHSPTESGGHSLSVRELAHELNSMLDGSMRCLNLARRALDEAGTTAHTSAPIDEALNRIDVACESMNHMARVLHQAMDQHSGGMRLLAQPRPLGMEVQHLIESLAPQSEEAGVRVEAHVAPSVADLTSGPLSAVILNGLKNAIEAGAVGEASAKKVELSLHLNARREVVLVIIDNGPGIIEGEPIGGGVSSREGGHGIGLDLCRSIVADLGGRLSLRNVPFGCGAILEVVIPLNRLLNG